MNFHPIIHRRTQRSLYELASGESGDPQMLAHIDACDACRRDLAEMREAIGLVDRTVLEHVGEPPEAYWTEFDDRVVRRISIEEYSDVVAAQPSWYGSRPAFLAGAASALAMVGIAAGAWWWTLGTTAGTVSETAAPVMSVRERTFDYFERSRVVLIGVLNADTKELGDAPELLKQNGEASRVLVEEARDLNRDLSDPKDVRLLRLVNELEVILVQLANLEAEEDVPGLEIIRDGVRRRGVLLKIGIEEMNRLPSLSNENGIEGTANGSDQRSL